MFGWAGLPIEKQSGAVAHAQSILRDMSEFLVPVPRPSSLDEVVQVRVGTLPFPRCSAAVGRVWGQVKPGIRR